MPHPFLSDEWVAEARKIREEYRSHDTTEPAVPIPKVRINHLITDVPFGDGEIQAHTDTTSGVVEMDVGHLDDAEATVTLPYDTAKAVIIDGDMQAAMQEFMSGRIKVAGDLTKLMAFQQAAHTVDPVAAEINARLRAITA